RTARAAASPRLTSVAGCAESFAYARSGVPQRAQDSASASFSARHRLAGQTSVGVTVVCGSRSSTIEQAASFQAEVHPRGLRPEPQQALQVGAALVVGAEALEQPPSLRLEDLAALEHLLRLESRSFREPVEFL